MSETGEILGAATTLFIKAVLLAARWAGAIRRRALEQFSAMSAEDKDQEILALRDRVYQLETRVAILLKQARSRGRAPRYSLRERLCVLWHMEYFQIPRRRVEEHFGIARSTLYRWLHCIEAEASSQSAPPNKTPRDLASLVWEIARANPHWGRMRVAGQLALLNIFLAASTVRNMRSSSSGTTSGGPTRPPPARPGNAIGTRPPKPRPGTPSRSPPVSSGRPSPKLA